MVYRSVFCSILIAFAVSGCSSPSGPAAIDATEGRYVSYDSVEGTEIRRAGVQSYEMERTGAAYRAAGPRHVLTDKPVTTPDIATGAYTKPSDPESQPLLGPSSLEAYNDTSSRSSKKLTRTAQISGTGDPIKDKAEKLLERAWQRYCNGGEGMTERDWRLIDRAGGLEAMPDDLRNVCTYPK